MRADSSRTMRGASATAPTRSLRPPAQAYRRAWSAAVEVRSPVDAGRVTHRRREPGRRPGGLLAAAPQLQSGPRAAALDRQSRRRSGARPRPGPDRNGPDRRRGPDQGQRAATSRNGPGTADARTRSRSLHRRASIPPSSRSCATRAPGLDVKVTIAPANKAGEQLSVGAGTTARDQARPHQGLRRRGRR